MSGTSRGNRYGQQGGRWIPPGVDIRDPNLSHEQRGAYWTAQMEKIRSRVKKKHQENHASPAWPNLAALRRSVRPETAVEWEGYARQARARKAAGVPLNELDIEAIQRCGEDTKPYLL